jgi:hypothetical protein
MPLTRRAMMKAVGLGSAALAAPALVAGCSSAGGRTSIVLEETKPEVIPYFDNLVAKFNASQRSISVTHDSTSSLIAEFVRGDPPDIDCDNYNLTTSIFVARGVLANLAGLPQAKTIEPNIQALVTQYASYKGETSVLPYSVAAEGVIYNVDLFDKVGISSVPTTWSEFLAVCRSSSPRTSRRSTRPTVTWTTQQGLFDYTVGGMIDVAGFYQQLNAAGTNLGPNSGVSFEKDFTAPCQKMLSMAPYFNDNAISKSVSVAIPGWHLAADRAQTPRHRRRSASWAFQRSGDAFCPALDLGPVAVVAEPTAESMEEQARGQRPLMSLDRASEDPVLTRVNRILELADLPGLAPHQLADPMMRVTERADTEQPHWSRGKRDAVGAQEPGRARDPALVVDAAAENDRVVSREVIDVIDGPSVDLGSGFCEPGGDSLGDTSSGSVLGRVGDENARTLAHVREPTPVEG